jgi:hypothetical protein
MTALAIDVALRDPQLLGAALGPAEPWAVWLATLKAAFGHELDADELARFHAVAGDRAPPTKRVRELWAAVSRRCGKTRMAAAIAVYLGACFDWSACLARGETGHILVMANTLDQAKECFGYAQAFLESSPILSLQIKHIGNGEIKLHGHITISIKAANYRTIRGKSVLCAILDEVAYFRDESSANPDKEVYRALIPAMFTTKGMMIGISSPYMRAGLLYQKYRDHHGRDGDILVVQGGSAIFNPLLDEAEIERIVAEDPEGGRADLLGEWRSDLTNLLDEASIEAAIDGARPLEIPPGPGRNYTAFVDPSGGRSDAFTMCIGHYEGEHFVADVVRGTRPKFDPQIVTAEYVKLAKEYGFHKVIGDNYSAEFMVGAVRDAGGTFELSQMPKAQLFINAVPLFARGCISIPDMPALSTELRLLERRPQRSGRDAAGHPKNGHDDFANALCGAAIHAKAVQQVTAEHMQIAEQANLNFSPMATLDARGAFPEFAIAQDAEMYPMGSDGDERKYNTAHGLPMGPWDF